MLLPGDRCVRGGGLAPHALRRFEDASGVSGQDGTAAGVRGTSYLRAGVYCYPVVVWMVAASRSGAVGWLVGVHMYRLIAWVCVAPNRRNNQLCFCDGVVLSRGTGKGDESVEQWRVSGLCEAW